MLAVFYAASACAATLQLRPSRQGPQATGWTRFWLVACYACVRIHRYTYAQYVALEQRSDTKHEFLDGEIYAMAGGSEDHSALAAEIIGILVGAVGDRPCRVHTSDLRVYVEQTGLATFPDASVICGPLEQHTPSPEATALNPTLLVEVTSDSSEEFDTTTKRDAYKTIPSLKEYVVVSHHERRVVVHRRDGDAWTTHVAITAGTVRAESLGVALVVDDLYRRSSIEP